MKNAHSEANSSEKQCGDGSPLPLAGTSLIHKID